MTDETTTTEQSHVAADCPNERLVICQGCGNNPATGPHSCPYAEEIGANGDKEYCTCCDDCRHECAMDI